MVMFDQLKNLKSLASLVGNSDEIRKRFEQIQSELEQIRVTGEAGAGAVRVTVNGKYRVMRVELDPVLLGSLAGDDKGQADQEMIEQLIAGATNAAQDKAQEQIGEHMQRWTGGLNLPGMDQWISP